MAGYLAMCTPANTVSLIIIHQIIRCHEIIACVNNLCSIADLGGGFKHFSCSPLFGEMIPFDEYFQMGWFNQHLAMHRLPDVFFWGAQKSNKKSLPKVDWRPKMDFDSKFLCMATSWNQDTFS